MKDYGGVIGKFSFTPDGDGVSSVAVTQTEKEQHELMQVVEVRAR